LNVLHDLFVDGFGHVLDGEAVHAAALESREVDDRHGVERVFAPIWQECPVEVDPVECNVGQDLPQLIVRWERRAIRVDEHLVFEEFAVFAGSSPELDPTRFGAARPYPRFGCGGHVGGVRVGLELDPLARPQSVADGKGEVLHVPDLARKRDVDLVAPIGDEQRVVLHVAAELVRQDHRRGVARYGRLRSRLVAHRLARAPMRY